MKNRSGFPFTSLNADLRGAVAHHLDLVTLEHLRMTAHSADGKGREGEPLLADNTLNPLLASALKDPALHQVVRVTRDGVDPFTRSATAGLQSLHNGQQRDALKKKLSEQRDALKYKLSKLSNALNEKPEDLPPQLEMQGHTKALQLIADYEEISAATVPERYELISTSDQEGREQFNVLPAIQRWALVDDSLTRPAILKRLARNKTASAAELVAIMGHYNTNRRYHDERDEAFNQPTASVHQSVQQRLRTAAARQPFLDSPDTPSEFLQIIAGFKNIKNLQAIIRHPNCDRATLLTLLQVKLESAEAKAALNDAIFTKHFSREDRFLCNEVTTELALHTTDPEKRSHILEVASRVCKYPLQTTDEAFHSRNPLRALAKLRAIPPSEKR
ncbi:MAG: hypothetical protein V4623_11160 [Pseudomonadota bacterium]